MLSRELAAAGFEITISDAAAGILTGKRVRTPLEQKDDITCRYAHGSMAERMAEAHFTITATATPTANGSAVQFVSRIVAKTGDNVSTMLRLPDNPDDCASTGVLEKRLADALQ